MFEEDLHISRVMFLCDVRVYVSLCVDLSTVLMQVIPSKPPSVMRHPSISTTHTLDRGEESEGTSTHQVLRTGSYLTHINTFTQANYCPNSKAALHVSFLENAIPKCIESTHQYKMADKGREMRIINEYP